MLTRTALALFVFFLISLAPAWAQDPSGRPTEPPQDPSGRPTEARPTKPSKKPAKTPPRRVDNGPATVTLTVLTDPPEAAVFVEGEPRGTSNGEGRLVLDRLRLGHYTIEVRKDGYRVAMRGFNAGTEAPTLVFKLEADLDPIVTQFDQLVTAGKLLGPDSPNAMAVVNDLATRFPERPETQRLRGVLAARLTDSITPVVANSVTNWQALTREQLARAADAANAVLPLRKDDNRLRAEAAFLKGALIFRDWQSGTSDAEASGTSLTQARAEFENALRADEAFAPAQLFLGLTLVAMKEWAAAELVFIKVTQLEPRWAQAVNSLGLAYYSQGKFKEAIDTYRRALQLEPQNARATAGLGLARVMKGEKDGVKDIERATQMDPASATAQLYLGLALAQSKEKKQRQRAEQALQKAVELNAKSGEFAAHVAEQALEDLKKKK
ncbi:MAG TPA: tetratricopeptide repeat protein [Blastocatellia bacterium]|nr:tetratricopeptide repeat protein [Blastocatellia bacterium]